MLMLMVFVSSELTPSVMDSRPHLFHNLPVPSHWYQITQLGDSCTEVWPLNLPLCY